MPAAQQQQQGPEPLVFEQFAGLNTSTTRPGVPDEQAYWIDGFMPIAPRELRTLWGIGSALYTAGVAGSIVSFDFYNIGRIPYAVVFINDGSAYQVATLTGTVINILPVGTIQGPTITNTGTSQYGQQYLIIVANQSNGYWVWDGSILYDAGSLGPGVILTNVGAGYVTPPIVTATGGHGTGATFVATINNGVVTNVAITNPGTGYLAGDSVALVFTGGTASGSGASVSASVSLHAGGSGASVAFIFTKDPYYTYGYDLTSVSVVNAGTGYSPFTVINIIGGHVYGSGGAVAPVVVGGSIASVNVVTVGIYDGNFSFPTPSITDAGFYFVSSTSIHNAGSGYGPNKAITVSGGGLPQSQAVLSGLFTSGSLASVSIVSGGIYGSITPAPTVTVTDSSTTATGYVILMPYGTQGTAVETYQGHVWVFNGPLKQWSAPGSVSDFSTADGGGSETSNASYLKVGYVEAVSTNGFLFEIGDSSMDYISGVQSTGTSVITTTFSENNCDPEIGSPYPAAVTTLGQDILVANSAGIFVSSGGAFVKRSEALDGVFNTVENFAGLQLSTAKATIFGKRVWMVLAPIIDPISGPPLQITNGATSSVSAVLSFASVPITIVPGQIAYDVTNPAAIAPGTTVLSTSVGAVIMSANAVGNGVSVGDNIVFCTQKLFMFNGRYWWASTQDVPLTFIAGQEINSTYTAWGTDGTHIYPLFSVPSTAFAKIAQSKLWDDPGYEANKTTSRLWSMWQCFNTAGASITANVDTVGIDTSGNQYTSTTPYGFSGPSAAGFYITPIQAVAAQGIMRGMTFETNAADLALISAKLASEKPVQYRG